MHTPTAMRLLTILLAASTAMTATAQGTGQGGRGDGLKWTPHRTAVANRSGAEGPAPEPGPAAILADGATAPTSPAQAATGLTRAATPTGQAAGVPTRDPRPLQSPAAGRRLDPRAAPAAGGFTDAFRRAIDPENPQGIFGAAFSRAPQGEVGRPLLADEQRPAAPRRQPAAPPVRQAQRSAGAAAAPVRPAQATARGPRSPRVAMNADGMPSVLAQAPNASVPTPAAPLPAPRAAADGGPSMGAPSPALTDTLPAGPGEIIIEDSMGGSLPSFDDGQPDGPMFLGEGPDGMPLTDDGFGGMAYGDDGMMPDGMMIDDGSGMIGPGWTGEVQLHVPSPYDDPFACEDGEPCGCLPFYEHDGRICAFLRRFGRPYYGWRWYRDFSASAGVTSFQNPVDLGVLGNYGFNEYANWGMPFWNALGVGWQVGVRGVQADFQSTAVRTGGSSLANGPRNQVFLTTGFYTRAFEGRGLQGGAVWDYLRDDLYDDVDLSQIRGEVSYVWGFNELGFWAAANSMGRKNIGPFGYADTETVDIYAGFYRLHFGDANELKAWSGGTGDGDFILGSLLRAPMNRSLALEGTFTYVIPQASRSIPLTDGTFQRYSGQAWNLSVNVVWYPACRARRGLASPYRPLFEVADNGSMIRTLDHVR